MLKSLEWLTKHLQNKVTSIYAKVNSLHLTNQVWQLSLDNATVVNAKNTVIATGATPKTMHLPVERELINIYTALDPKKLANACKPEDTIAIFGSSHTAIILIRNLLELGVQKVINFYRTPLRFAVRFPDWILFDDTGLKGETATWARKHINGKLPQGLERIYSSSKNIAKHLTRCNKVIQALGFQRRAPLINGLPEWDYNSANGIMPQDFLLWELGFLKIKLILTVILSFGLAYGNLWNI